VKEEWIAGKHPVLEALKTQYPVNKIWLAKESKPNAFNDIMERSKEQGIVVQWVPRKKLDQVAKGISHQGVLAFVAAYPYAELDHLLQRAEEKGEPPFLLILDGLEDPHNLGSILRTADAAGVHGVILPKRRSVGLTATVAKTSAGAIHYVPVARVTNLANTIEKLKKENIWVYGSGADAKLDYRQIDYRGPVALVIGHEGKGISRLVWEKCDEHIRLPLAGQVSSLNASVAAGVLMYEVYRQRAPLD
jgi:23S rRNA (guanosine2251-2'-O)-methyltransferase